jgi:hypothetical protein
MRGARLLCHRQTSYLRSENLFLRPRHARSVGRHGGLEAERNRDKATLCVLVSNPEATVVEIAMATGVGHPTASRRPKRLAASGLTKPVCSPSRAWMLTDVGHAEIALADEADLLKRVDLNGNWAPWVAPLSAMKLSRETYSGYGRAEPVRVEGDVEHKEERPESVRRRKEPVHRVLTESGAWMSV